MSCLTIFFKLDLQISPQDCYYSLCSAENLVFLDSSLPSKYSKYSYIGFNPLLTARSWGHRNEVDISGKLKYTAFQHPLSFLNDINKAYGDRKDVSFYIADEKEIKKAGKRKRPSFCGGFMGYISYDLKDYIERLSQTAEDDYSMPMIYLALFERLLAYSHKEKQWYYVRNFDDQRRTDPGGSRETVDLKIIYSQIKEETRAIMGNFDQKMDYYSSIISRYGKMDPGAAGIKSNFEKSQYLEAVCRAKKYIHEGDIYQVNLSQRFTADLEAAPCDLYYVLRKLNPAPYSAYIKTPEFHIASTSPERFLYVEGDYIQTRPIKGTRPRGKTRLQDSSYARDLKSSIKDRAELNMIVDLERNDLGKFCYYGSVKVEEHAVIEKYARVMHSVSTVSGRIKKPAGLSDIIKAAFPGGSITGAPKIRAMKIIDELEPNTRSVYTGSIGYIGIDGTLDLNIAIRTMIIKGTRYCYNVGGGIVEDSVPEEEYRETLDKGLAIREAIKFFGKKI